MAEGVQMEAVSLVAFSVAFGAALFYFALGRRTTTVDEKEEPKSTAVKTKQKKAQKKAPKEQQSKAIPKAKVATKEPQVAKELPAVAQVKEGKVEIPSKLKEEKQLPVPVQETVEQADKKAKKKKNKKVEDAPSVDAEAKDFVAAISKPVPADDGGWETVKSSKPNKKKMDSVTIPSGNILIPQGQNERISKKSGEPQEQSVIDIGDMASVIIGEKGLTINNIQTITGAKLNTNKAQKTCTITGTATQVDAARRIVEELLVSQNVVTIPLRNRLEEAIVRNTEHLRMIQANSGSRLAIVSESTGAVCKLTGTAEQVQEAKLIITKLLQEKADTETMQSINVEPHMARQLIGKKGQNISSLQQVTGANIHVTIDEPLSTVTIMGTKEQKNRGVEEVQRFIRDRSAFTVVPIDKIPIGIVLSNLKSLRISQDVRIDVTPDGSSLKLTGTKQDISEAKSALLSWISTELGPPSISVGQTLETIELGTAAGKVIGSGGSVITELKNKAPGVNIVVKTSTCYVYGEPSAVAKTKAEILSIVEKHSETVARAEKEEKIFAGGNWALRDEAPLTGTKELKSNQWGTSFSNGDATMSASIASDWGGILSAEGW